MGRRAGKPIHASKHWTGWCLKRGGQSWSRKSRTTGPDDVKAAEKAYDVARAAYRAIPEEAEGD